MEGIGRARSNRNRKPTTLHIFSPPLSTHPFNYTDSLLHSTQPPPHGPHCAASPTNAAQHLIHDPPSSYSVPFIRGQPNNAPLYTTQLLVSHLHMISSTHCRTCKSEISWKLHFTSHPVILTSEMLCSRLLR